MKLYISSRNAFLKVDGINTKNGKSNSPYDSYADVQYLKKKTKQNGNMEIKSSFGRLVQNKK